MIAPTTPPPTLEMLFEETEPTFLEVFNKVSSNLEDPVNNKLSDTNFIHNQIAKSGCNSKVERL